jgi:hypothetical protein
VTAFDAVQVNNHPGAYSNYLRPTIGIYEQEDETFILDSNNHELHEIAKSVLLLRDSLVVSFQTASICQNIDISEDQVQHLELLFDLLIASTHTACASAIMQRYDAALEYENIGSLCKSRVVGGLNRGHGSKILGSTGSKYPTTGFLDERNLTLASTFGSVRVKILSARSTDSGSISRTLAFNFEYLGNVQLDLAPFSVQFVAHGLDRYFPVINIIGRWWFEPHALHQPCLEYFATLIEETEIPRDVFIRQRGTNAEIKEISPPGTAIVDSDFFLFYVHFHYTMDRPNFFDSQVLDRLRGKGYYFTGNVLLRLRFYAPRRLARELGIGERRVLIERTNDWSWSWLCEAVIFKMTARKRDKSLTLRFKGIGLEDFSRAMSQLTESIEFIWDSLINGNSWPSSKQNLNCEDGLRDQNSICRWA